VREIAASDVWDSMNHEVAFAGLADEDEGEPPARPAPSRRAVAPLREAAP
jgi:hypothetical protein